MAEKLCPHCNHAVPPEFAVMPVCMMCGGDLNAQPTQVWSAIDLQGGTSFNCPSCQTVITSVLTTECPACGAALQPGAAPTPATVQHDIPLELVLEETPVQDHVAPTHVEPIELPSFVSAPAIPVPEPVRRSEPAQPVARPTPKPVKEGFFARLLRMLGLKK